MTMTNEAVEATDAVQVGGTEYNVLYKPNLSREAREGINNSVTKSASGDSTDIYDTESVREALNDGRLVVSTSDEKVINAISQSYIEIQ